MEPPNRLTAGVLAAAAIVLVGLLIIRGSDDDNGEGEFPHVEALPSSACDEVEYGGEGEPNALIASDLPMQGDSAGRSEQMVAAIRQVLDNQGWQAGQTRIAFQACDDSIPDTGEWDADKCKDNATNYVTDEDVIGVIGTYNSGCAAEIIPILNGAPGGGVAMVSPGNTLICLTEPAAGCEPGQPDSLYPSGARNYARVVPTTPSREPASPPSPATRGCGSPTSSSPPTTRPRRARRRPSGGRRRRSASRSPAMSPGTRRRPTTSR